MRAARWIPAVVCAAFASVVAIAAETGSEMPSDMPPPALTLGAQGGEGLFEGFGDILAPVYLTKSGLWFVNPRLTITDEDEEELNAGIGYRHLFPAWNIILGGNIYYDSRWTQYDNHFNQLGLGVEFLSEWVDARANYYLPEDDEELADTYTETDVQVSSSTWTSWRDPYAIEHRIEQRGTRVTRTTTTTTTYLFEMYEQAREGWDAEIGVKLPGLDKWADVKVFGGYYSWDGEYAGTEKIEGAKGRLEVRALPALYLDAAVFEDAELNGSDWTVGARLSLPFDTKKLSQKKNPFEGALAKKEKPAFANRLVDMVMRDLHVRTEASPWEENVEARQVCTETSTRKKRLHDTLMDDIIFVDDDRGNDANPGTTEEPKQTIQNGVDSAFGERNVYVYAGDYRENVVLDAADSDIQIYGQGYPIKGHGGKKFGGDRHPVLNGSAANQLPCFRLQDADFVSIRGFELTHDPGMAFVVNDGVFGTYPINFTGVEAENADFLLLSHNRIHDYSYGALILANDADGTDDYALRLLKNEFVGCGDDGVQVDVVGGSGLFMLASRGNNYSGNDDAGINVNAANFDTVVLTFENDRANDNVNGDGFDFESVDDNNAVFLAMRNIRANRNGNCGIDADQIDGSTVNDGAFFGLFDGIRANNNGDAGLDVNVLGNLGPAMVLVSDGRFNNNGDEGIDIDLENESFALAAIGVDGAIMRAIETFVPFDTGIRGSGLVVASGNAADGISVTIDAPDAALAALFDVQANFNGGGIGGDGIGVNLVSDEGIAGALFIPSATLLGLAQPALDFVTDLLGLPSINLPRARYHGPIQAIGNEDNGIDVEATGFGSALGAFVDINAWLNGGSGVEAYLAEADTAAAFFGGVDAWANGANGIDLGVDGNELGVGVFVDVWAEDNVVNGIHAEIRGDTAVGLMATTRLMDDLMDALGIGINLGGQGPNRASRNGNYGFYLGVEGDTAYAIGLDTVANDNGNYGLTVEATAAAGGAVGALWRVQALRNANYGLLLDVEGAEAYGVLADFRANDNADSGAYVDVTAFDGTAAGIVGTTEFVDWGLGLVGAPFNLADAGIRPFGPNQANRNGNAGLGLRVEGTDQAIAAIVDTHANDNTAVGISAVADATTGDMWAGLAQVRANRNGNAGVLADFTASDDLRGVLYDIQARNNVGDGIRAALESTERGTYAAFMNIRTTGNGDDGLDVSLTGYYEVMAALMDIRSFRNVGSGLQLTVDQAATDGRVDLFLGQDAFADFAALLDALGYVTLPPELIAMAPPRGIFANRNGRDGVYVDVNAAGTVSALLNGVHTHDNTGNGIYVDATSSDNPVNLGFLRCWGGRNGADGIHTVAASPGTVAIAMEGSGGCNNFGDGIEINATAPLLTLDLGGGVVSAGLNEMWGNAGLGLNNSGGGTISAENNYWGGGAPVFGVDYGAGVTAPATWLNVNP